MGLWLLSAKRVAGECPGAERSDGLGEAQELDKAQEAAAVQRRARQGDEDRKGDDGRDEQQAHPLGKLERDAEVEGDEQAEQGCGGKPREEWRGSFCLRRAEEQAGQQVRGEGCRSYNREAKGKKSSKIAVERGGGGAWAVAFPGVDEERIGREIDRHEGEAECLADELGGGGEVAGSGEAEAGGDQGSVDRRGQQSERAASH